MKILNCRFGDLEYQPEDLILFPEGLIGFEHLHDFVMMPNRPEKLPFWIQSITNPDFALMLAYPELVFPDYNFTPDQKDKEKLGLIDLDGHITLSIVTLHKNQTITFNLAAPIILAPTTSRALQCILEGAPYNTRTPLI